MLVSHKHRFIFIKTIKTAGTSVEALLEPLCAPPGHVVTHATPELVTEYGIIGRRGKAIDSSPKASFRAHMHADEIEALLPQEFASYTRIANVRNPYDKSISSFHMESGLSVNEAARLATETPEMLRALFSDHVASLMVDDRERLRLRGKPAADRVIRFETLVCDLEQLNSDLKLGLTDIQRNLPTFKRTKRATKGAPVSAYLSADSIRRINSYFDWYFEMFDYPRLTP